MSALNATALLPLYHAALRTLRFPTPVLSAVAERVWTVAPGTRAHRRPSLFLPGQLERITGVQKDTSLEAERCRIQAGPVEHAPTLAYLLRDAVLLEGALYKGAFRESLRSTTYRCLLGTSTCVSERASLGGRALGNRYFGHWLIDDCTTQRAIAQRDGEFGQAYLPLRTLSPHEQQYSVLLGLAPRRVRGARFRELVVFDDRGQNAFKRERYEWMRSTLLAGVGLTAHPASHPGVFVLRGSAGASRTLRAERELAAALAQRRGLRVVDPMQASASEIVRACAGARVVVGVEGSALVHAVMVMGPGSALICLQPPWRFNNHLKDLTDCRELSYGFVVGLPMGEEFSIPLDEIERTLDLVETEACTLRAP